jgi:hypothetical protein
MEEEDFHSGYHNVAMFRFRAGAGSSFREGTYVEGDLCDVCLFTLLGRYVRAYDEAGSFAGRREGPPNPFQSRRPSMVQTEFNQPEVTVVICDRCSKRMSEGDPGSGFQNRTQIRFRAGYGSLFGDGNKVEGDLCDQCLVDLLGPYLRVVESNPVEAKQYNDLAYKPLDAYFDLQARRIYSPYQCQYQTAEDVACALRDWIDRQFAPGLKRTPVVPVVPPKNTSD